MLRCVRNGVGRGFFPPRFWLLAPTPPLSLDADPYLTARWLSHPLTFERYHDAAIEMTDRMRQAENAATYLLGLTNVNPDPFLSYLPAIINYCVLFFPTSTRFGGREAEKVEAKDEAEAGQERTRRGRHEKDLPQLLYNMILILQPLMAAKVKGVPEEDATAYVRGTNKLLALVRCGVDVSHLLLDWMRPIGLVQLPLVTEVPQLDVTQASSAGSISPIALIDELNLCIQSTVGGFTEGWATEALKWALHETGDTVRESVRRSVADRRSRRTRRSLATAPATTSTRGSVASRRKGSVPEDSCADEGVASGEVKGSDRGTSNEQTFN